jgi:hypothetical protein
MKRAILFTLFLSLGLLSYGQNEPLTGHYYVEVSKTFLTQLKTGEDASQIVRLYEKFDFNSLASQVDTREEKLAFWVNTYNAYVQYLLTIDPALFEDRGAFFSQKRVVIAGINMSFDDIEHGIIRDSRVKLGLGILKKWFPPQFERKLRINNRDGRVHFALNCGAKTCPPIVIYDDRKIYEQLDEIAGNYLRTVSVVRGNKVTTSPLFSWFRGDFGGRRGIKKLLLKYKIIETKKGIKLGYGDYDWTLKTGNYMDEVIFK